MRNRFIDVVFFIKSTVSVIIFTVIAAIKVFFLFKSAFRLLIGVVFILRLIFGIGAIVFSIISKKTLGYFDGMSIAGLVCGIFGCVFGASIILTSLLLPEEFFDEFYYEYYNGTNQF